MTKEHILLIIRDTYPQDHDKAADIIMQAWKKNCLSEEWEEREAWTDCYIQTFTRLLASSKINHTLKENIDPLIEASRENANIMIIERRKRFGKTE